MTIQEFMADIKPRGWTLLGGEIVRTRDGATGPLVHVARQHGFRTLTPEEPGTAGEKLGLRPITTEKIAFAARYPDEDNPLRVKLLARCGLKK